MINRSFKQMNRLQRRLYLIGKYTFDKVFSACFLLFFSPFVLLISLIVWIEEPRVSPFYSQIRVGKNGRLFRMYKFRTMVADADHQIDELLSHNEMDGPVFKIRDDARITPVGKILRRTGLDEILQFFNVLKGDMSVVGPRPPLEREVALYDEHHRKRLLIRPGITCLWQIMPDRNNVKFDEWVELDLRYIRERSFALDMRIMKKTVTAMLHRQGS